MKFKKDHSIRPTHRNTLSIALTLGVTMTMVFTASSSNVVTLKDVFEAANAIRANPSSYANVVKTQIRDKQDANGTI